jgi:predicted nucleotide-binding protein
MPFHVYLFEYFKPGGNTGQAFAFANLDEAQLQDRVVARWDQGLPITWDGRTADSLKSSIKIFETMDPIADPGKRPTHEVYSLMSAGTDVTNDRITGPAGDAGRSTAPRHAAESEASLSQDIFIVHGQNAAMKHEVARTVRALTGNDPTILHEQANKGQTLIEKFERNATGKGFAVILLTADDVGHSANEQDLKPRGRQNVVFEFGFFVGNLGRGRVALLYEDGVELPSDLNGLVYIPLDAGGGWKLKLGQEFRAAGLEVDLNRLG